MIARVYEAVSAGKLVSETIVATDAREVVEHCEKLGIPARLTSAEHRSGTDRVYEIAGSVDADVYINVQGDEPLTRPEHLDSLIRLMQQPGVEVGTLKIACAAADVANPNVVKVVCDATRPRALFLPQRDSVRPRPPRRIRYFKHLGLYAYRKRALELFCSWPESELGAG